MKTLYYLLLFIPICIELQRIFTLNASYVKYTKEQELFSKKDKKDIENYIIFNRSSLVRNTLYIILIITGLWSSQWQIFAVLLTMSVILGFILKRIKIVEFVKAWMFADSIVTIGLLSYVIFNYFNFFFVKFL